MDAREPTLPEGTDQIINTGSGLGGSGTTGGLGGTTGTGSASGASTAGLGGTSGTTGSGTGSGSGSAFFEEGRSSTTGSGTASEGMSKAADNVVNQIKDQVNNLRGQAGERARGFADDGKRQTTDFLQSLAQIIQEAAQSVEEKLGSQYAGFGNRAADSVNSFSQRIDQKSVDDLVEDARSFVQRSPAIAIGVAAVIGFAAARVLRSGIDDFGLAHPGTGTDSDAGTTGAAGFADDDYATGGVGTGTTGMNPGGTLATPGFSGTTGPGSAGTR